MPKLSKIFLYSDKNIRNGLELDNQLGFQKPPLLCHFRQEHAGMTTELEYIIEMLWNDVRYYS